MREKKDFRGGVGEGDGGEEFRGDGGGDGGRCCCWGFDGSGGAESNTAQDDSVGSI